MEAALQITMPSLPARAEFLEKPFTAQTPLGCVRGLLDAAR
jgi:hypothetical protein